MTDVDQQIPSAALLSPHELRAIQDAQVLYGALAKIATAQLAEAVGLDEAGSAQMVGAVQEAMTEREMDIEGRRQLASGLSWLVEVIGGNVTRPKVRPVETDGIAQDEPAAGGEQDVPAPRGEQDSPTNELSLKALNWFKRFMAIEEVARIEKLSPGQRELFLNNVFTRYKAIKSYKMTAEDKEKRVAQAKAYLSGSSYAQLAEEYGSTTPAINQAIRQVSLRIGEHIDKAVISQHLAEAEQAPINADPGQDIVTDKDPAQAEIITTPEQTKWLDKVMDGTGAKSGFYLRMGLASKQFFAGSIGELTMETLSPRISEVVAERRTQQVILLLQGKTYEEIAEQLARPIKNIKLDLHDTAEVLNRRTAPDRLVRLITESRNQVDD